MTGTMVAMTSYFARYERGERDDVWRELHALGPKALDASRREDAAAVARSMALRARRNVELIESRLTEAGFDFRGNDDEGVDRPGHIPPTAGAAALVEWMERELGPMPLTVAAWIREVGDVWFVGDHPRWTTSDLADPLVVEFEGSAYPGHDVRTHLEGQIASRGENRSCQLYFAPDDYHKANISGGSPYAVEVAAPAVDGWCLPFERFFVDYLNDAFASGGFPGALVAEGYEEPPPGLRESLAEDVLRL